MDEHIQYIVSNIQQQYKLDTYFLKRYTIFHEKGASYQSEYTLSMEWFPSNQQELTTDEDLNPDGTVAMEVDFHSQALRRLIFVNEVPHPNANELFPTPTLEEVVAWVQKVTHLTLGTQFDLAQQTGNSFHFVATTEQIKTTPPGVIQVEFNDNKELTLFSIDGIFPTKDKIKREKFSLKKEEMEPLFRQQLKLVEIPVEEEKRWVPIYGLDELYVRNGGKKTLNYPTTQKEVLHLPMEWETSLQGPFERKDDMDLSTEVTVEQAIENKPHMDSYPLTDAEKKAAVNETRDFLRKEHPEESGEWMLHTLARDHGYLIAEIQPKQEKIQVLPRKVKVMIDRTTLQAIDYIDNISMLAMFADYQAAETVHISFEEAYEKLKDYMDLIPTYVYQPEEDGFYLYGKVDSDFGVIATTGEIINLSDL